MFGHRNTFLNESTRTTYSHHKRSQMRRFFSEPPTITANPIVTQIFNNFYYCWRRTQFSLCYKAEAEDAQSLTDLIKFEPTEKTAPIQTLLDLTHNRFDRRYLKYLYQRFKNDLIVCLSLLQSADARVNAEWTMRLINGSTSDRISFDEFRKFVQSIFTLNGGLSTNLNGSNNGESIVAVQRSIIDGEKRASVIFKEIDTTNRKYLTVEDLEILFQNKGTDFF
ncbi:EF hand [Aphelenchoides besseyi]|nr:EF hand [Aphelenchoides besseyi]KAI6199911.1 EF hand [Aphelenchoides besseyi]